jgi:hypothetical protein
MAYDPALLLRKSWASPDELAQELYVLMTAAQREASRPEVPPARSRVTTRPPAGVISGSAPSYAQAQYPTPSAPPSQPDIVRARQILEAARPPGRHDPELPRQPEETPPGQPLTAAQAPETPPKIRPALVSIQAPVARRDQPATDFASVAGSELAMFLGASITTATFDLGPPATRSLPAAEPSESPGLRQIPQIVEPIAHTTQFSPTLYARSQSPGFRPTAVPTALPTGTPAPITVEHPLAEFPLEPLHTELARKDLATHADNVKPAVIPDPPFRLIVAGLVQIDKDGVTALKPPGSGGEGQGTPGQGKAYLLDFNGNNLELNSGEPLTVWNLGDTIAPNTYTEAFRIQEEYWWVIGRNPGGAFFADHLTIAAATGLLTGPPTLHSTTGNVYRINNGAMELYKSSATIYNGMPDATDNTMRQIMNENVDGTFTVTNESCTAP